MTDTNSATGPSKAARTLVAFGFAGLSGLIWWQTSTDLVAKEAASGGPRFDAAMVPELLATILVGLVFLQIVAIWRQHDKIAPLSSPQNGEAFLAPPPRPEAHLDFRSFLCVVSLVGFIVVVKPLGFYIAMFGLVSTLNAVMFVRNPFLNIAIAAVITGVSGFVFGEILNVVLPAGVLEIAPF